MSFGLLSKSKNFVSNFFRENWLSDPLVKYPFAFALITNIIIWTAILIKIKGESKPLPLHFSPFYGIDFVGGGYTFLKLPLIGLILLAVNIWFSRRVYLSEKFLSYSLSFFSFFLQLVFLAASLAIFFFNR